ncbi:hypothetical protein X777_10836 [Ooceraea biroi]|uniref:Uncharacterized protein n=1 Tax=Ooceraea biroi TaxID=2015173 RepID=A0A026W593_OOCBI|nr:hypothetical protein X777_10836 [Ooceraea biroi]
MLLLYYINIDNIDYIYNHYYYDHYSCTDNHHYNNHYNYHSCSCSCSCSFPRQKKAPDYYKL